MIKFGQQSAVTALVLITEMLLSIKVGRLSKRTFV
jgi:hypothetical protein